MRSVSVVMTAYKRANLLEQTLVSIEKQKYKPLEVIVCEDGDDGGATKNVCEQNGAIYLQRKHRPDIRYSNPAVPNNIGIRNAKNEVIILQNAECVHVGNVIKLLESNVEDKVAVFASVQALNRDGSFDMWYTHPVHNRRPFFFCGAMLREHFHYLRGFDEDFRLYGYDDDNFRDRLQAIGIEFKFADNRDTFVQHLWHPPSFLSDERTNQQMYETKKKLLAAGLISLKANLGRNWGVDE